MTPPLGNRYGNKPLPSPASSPNLSVRSAMSAPPTIRIDKSAPELPIQEDSNPELSPMQQKVLQLPPVNTWVPKGESLFNTILDSRSPQIYRRTTVSVSKPASFPQSTGGSIQSSRVSWPQRSQSYQPQLSPPTERHTLERHSESLDLDKSPKLFRKCTSFDLERSKPFPARSKISSPILIKKGTSVDEGETTVGQIPSPKLSKWSPSDTLEADSEGVVLKEVDEGLSETLTVTCLSDDTHEWNVNNDDADNDIIEFDAARINESLEDPTIPETAILNDIVSECNQMAAEGIEIKHGKSASDANGHSDNKPEPFSFGSSPELGAKPKSKKTSTSSDTTGKKPAKSKTGHLKQKSKDSPKLTLKSKSGPTAVKADKGSESHEKAKTKSPVKSALLSSAAKLKAISKKNPVTLLSYKSHSISIPDQSERPERPFSTSDVDTENKHKNTGVHQTESSPTVLSAELGFDDGKIDLDKNTDNIEKKDESDVIKSENKKSVVPRSKSETSTGSKKPVQHCETHGAKKCSQAVEGKKAVKSKTVPKSSGEKAVKTPAVHKSASVDTKVAKSGAAPKIASTSRTMSEPAEAHGSKRKIESKVKTTKKDTKTKDTKPKSRIAGKRDSITSLNSDSSKKSDHFHDCCHVRRKPADKK